MSALFLFLNKTINVCEKVCSHTVVSFNLLALLITYKLIGEEESKFSKKGVPLFRNSCPEVFCQKSVIRNFTKFTEKHLCQSLFFHKVAGLRPATLLKKRLWHRCFPVNFVKFLRKTFSKEHLWWLLVWL